MPANKICCISTLTSSKSVQYGPQMPSQVETRRTDDWFSDEWLVDFYNVVQRRATMWVLNSSRFCKEQLCQICTDCNRCGQTLAGTGTGGGHNLKFRHCFVIENCCTNRHKRTDQPTHIAITSYAVSNAVYTGQRSRWRLLCDDFRGVAISPILSKVFEYLIIFWRLLIHNLASKKTSVAIMQYLVFVRTIVESFVRKGSTVNLCAIDLSKAFDKVNLHALFIKLMKRNVLFNY